MVYPLGLRNTLLGPHTSCLSRTFVRYKSLTAAIERGRSGRNDYPSRSRSSRSLREDRTVGSFDRPERRPKQSFDTLPRAHRASYGAVQNHHARLSDSRLDQESRNRPGRYSSFSARRSDEASQSSWKSRSANRRSGEDDQDEGRTRLHRRERRDDRFENPRSSRLAGSQPKSSSRDTSEKGMRNSVREVESLPYTTAASEFIYGYSSVLAALKAKRRKFYELYVHSRGADRDGFLGPMRARKLFAHPTQVGDEYVRAMDKASNGRPHNGVILEASPLPVLPITTLREASMQDASFGVVLDKQSAEEAAVNGKQETYSYKSSGWRHPLILYVDGVLDEGNLGAIARSAYFLGVDAIITPSRQTAPWSHIAVKASAGAAEAIPLFKVAEPTDFLGKSSRAGWRIYASDAVPSVVSISGSASTTKDEDFNKVIYTFSKTMKRLPTDHSPVSDHPTILMMGAEGTGLRQSLLNSAHYKVGIVHGRDVDEIGVDSLNVSVAASILCYEMLQRPSKQSASDPKDVLF